MLCVDAPCSIIQLEALNKVEKSTASAALFFQIQFAVKICPASYISKALQGERRQLV